MELLGVLALLGGVAGFASGLLGIGGGILMVPLLLYVPPLAGLPVLDMKAVAGVTMAQSLAASVTGTLTHGRRIHAPLVLFMGGGAAAGALAGGIGSRWVAAPVLEGVFAFLALAAGLLMLLPVRGGTESAADRPVAFSRPNAAALGLAIGIVGGLVGQGGGFLIVPGLIHLLRVPTRVALGNSLAIGLLAGSAGFLGKAATAQIPLWLAVAAVAGATAAAWAGSRFSDRLSQATLRRTLALVILATALRMGVPLIVPAAITTMGR